MQGVDDRGQCRHPRRYALVGRGFGLGGRDLGQSLESKVCLQIRQHVARHAREANARGQPRQRRAELRVSNDVDLLPVRELGLYHLGDHGAGRETADQLKLGLAASVETSHVRNNLPGDVAVPPGDHAAAVDIREQLPAFETLDRPCALRSVIGRLTVDMPRAFAAGSPSRRELGGVDQKQAVRAPPVRPKQHRLGFPLAQHPKMAANVRFMGGLQR